MQGAERADLRFRSDRWKTQNLLAAALLAEPSPERVEAHCRRLLAVECAVEEIEQCFGAKKPQARFIGPDDTTPVAVPEKTGRLMLAQLFEPSYGRGDLRLQLPHSLPALFGGPAGASLGLTKR